MDIGVVIKKYRKEAGMTQEEMANRLGVATPAVQLNFSFVRIYRNSARKILES